MVASGDEAEEVEVGAVEKSHGLVTIQVPHTFLEYLPWADGTNTSFRLRF
jgi:hypothetical protein